MYRFDRFLKIHLGATDVKEKDTGAFRSLHRGILL